jgi:hypothetical protein
MILRNTRLEKSSAPFRPFFDKSGKSSAPDFPSPANFFFRPFLCFAAEISAPWQHWIHVRILVCFCLESRYYGSSENAATTPARLRLLSFDLQNTNTSHITIII